MFLAFLSASSISVGIGLLIEYPPSFLSPFSPFYFGLAVFNALLLIRDVMKRD